MTAMKLKSLQIIDKANVKNTNILYFICLFIVVFINIILIHKESFYT